MPILSELLRFDLDGAGSARLDDLAVDLASGDYPVVTHLVLRRSLREFALLPWDAVEQITWRDRRIRLAHADQARTMPYEELNGLVLLKRDLLDSLVLDLANRHTTLANDLWLREEEGALLLRGADVSPWAVVRRLSRGWLGHGSERNLLDWKDVEFLRGDPEAARAGGDYHRRVIQLQPGAIARLVEAMPYLHAAELLALLPDSTAADVLEVMMPERQLQVFEEYPPDIAPQTLALMAPDAAADLVGRLPPDSARQLLERMPTPQHDRLIELLRYPDNTAGGIMTNDVVTVEAALSVRQAREAIRDHLRKPDFVYYLYAVDDLRARRLRGVITLRDLLIAGDEQRVEEVMADAPETIDPLEEADVAARRVADNSLAALPVVGRDGRLIGAVTADSAVARLAPRAWSEQAPRVFS